MPLDGANPDEIRTFAGCDLAAIVEAGSLSGLRGDEPQRVGQVEALDAAREVEGSKQKTGRNIIG